MRPANERPKTEIKSIEQPGRPLCIVVLGMHRSGTSVIAGVLGLLGASLPKKMMPLNASNPKGYFEPNDIVELHDEMLSELGSSWADCRRLDPALFNSAAIAPYRTRLVAALKTEYGNATKFVVKDPRICRFFPFWRDVAAAFGAETRVVFVIRNPLEVARSLAQRDEFSLGYGLNLWLRNILDAEFDTRHSKRTFVSNSDFMRDWMHVIKEIESELGIELSEHTPELQAAVETLIDRGMRHHAVDEETLALESRDHPLVIKVYRALKKLVQRSSDPKALNALDEVRELFDEATRTFGYDLGADLISTQSKLYSARGRIEELEFEASSSKERIAAAHSRVRELEAILAERESEITHLNAQILAMEEKNKNNLAEITALRDLRKVDQERISNLGSLLEPLWANEIRQKNEQRQLEGRVARLTTDAANMARELEILRSSVSWRIGKPFRLVSRKLRGLQT